MYACSSLLYSTPVWVRFNRWDEWSLLGAIGIHLTLTLNPNPNPNPIGSYTVYM